MSKLAIIDIDVTIADLSHREHLVQGPKKQQNWDAFIHPQAVAKDPAVPGAREAIHKLIRAGYDLVFLTGRNDGLADVTQEWLINKMGVETYMGKKKSNDRGYQLLMRPKGNQETATIYKGRLMKQIMRGRKDAATLAFDDDAYMWSIYAKHGCVVFKAPDCWASLFPESEALPTEVAWRK